MDKPRNARSAWRWSKVRPPPSAAFHVATDAILAAIVASTDDAVIGKTLDGEILSWNPGAERMYGYTAQEAIGRHISMLCPPGRADEIPEILARLRRGERIDHFETVRQRRDGSAFDASVTVSPIADASGAVVGASSIGRDITERKRAETIFRDLLEAVPDAIVVFDRADRVVVANARAQHLFGYTHEDLLALELGALIPEASGLRAAHADEEFAHGPRAHAMASGLEALARHRNGSAIPVAVSFGPVRTGSATLVSASIRDVRDRQQAKVALQEAEERFRGAFAEAPIGMAMLTRDERFVEVNDALCALTGYTADELLRTSLGALTHPDDLEEFGLQLSQLLAGVPHHAERRLIDAGGHPIWVALHVARLRTAEGRPERFLAQMQDVTDRRHDDERLRRLADADGLTGLLNRRSFMRELDVHYTRHARYGGGGAVIVLDLDYLKAINDTLGHSAGDDVLIAVAYGLRARLRDSDLLARLGGDEFAVLLPHAGAEDAQLVASELLGAVRAQSVALAGARRALTASAGIALFAPGAGVDGAEVLANADAAMYDAKRAGRNHAKLHEPAADGGHPMAGRATWTTRIQQALDQGGFTLLAQPIVELATGRTRQHELLLRMRDEDGVLVPPAVFLHAAERLGLTQEIDRWVTEQAIDVIAARRAQQQDLTLEINLAASSIGDPGLLELIARRLEQTGVAPERLIFEIAEISAILDTHHTSLFAAKLAELGCRLALDNFADDHGSVTSLRQLPCDFLKLDGALVAGCATNRLDRLLIGSLADIATAIGTQTIAEHVGDEETTRVLAELGVDYGQGFHLGRPVPLDGVHQSAAA